MPHLRLSLDALQVLDRIAHTGSFAAAGESLHRTTSTLSYTVRKLERDLGVVLFDRSGHRATLTEAGRRRLAKALPLWEKAQRRVIDVLGERRWRELFATLQATATAGER